MKTRLKHLLSLFVAVLLTGCGETPNESANSGDDSTAGGTAADATGEQPNASPADPPANTPAEPAFRLLDAAADQELKDAFGIFAETRDAAKEKYKSQRWRFHGRIGDKTGDFAVVHPSDLADVSVHFRTQAEADRAEKEHEYLLEVTVDDWLSRHLVDAVVISEGSRPQ
jgi:hypothetical protein